MYFLIWTAVLVALIWIYLHKKYSRFHKYGVKHFKVVPILGNMTGVVLQRKHLFEEMKRSYHTFPGERFIGSYQFLDPTLIIRDIELVKTITVKEFENFHDHRLFIDEKIEPIAARNLFLLRGQEWKDMRSTLSPAFTSSKIKAMVPFMEEVGEQMIKSLNEKIEASQNGHIDVDCKDLTSRYGNDVIASCAFGLKVNSHKDENNEFLEMGKTATAFKLRQMLIFFILSAFPSLGKNLKLNLFSKRLTDFFVNLVLNTMKEREAKNIIRPDMIHLLMEVRKGRKLANDDERRDEIVQDTGFATVEESNIGKKSTNRVWADIDLVAQAVLFFMAGFESVSTATSFALHELAVNPDIQERLVREIKKENLRNGGKIDFSSIQKMTYMDMVTSEVLRFWPPAMALDRVCENDYNLGKANDQATQDYIVKKGEVVWIPVACFHSDPTFFPNPQKFDPERFSEDNKHTINPLAYMPFGAGPRNCIGSRFALCELKVLLYQILLNFEVSPSDKTQLPAKLSAVSFNPRLEGGHWLRFKKRN